MVERKGYVLTASSNHNHHANTFRHWCLFWSNRPASHDVFARTLTREKNCGSFFNNVLKMGKEDPETVVAKLFKKEQVIWSGPVQKVNEKALMTVCSVVFLVFLADAVHSHFVPNTGLGVTDVPDLVAEEQAEDTAG